MRRKLLELLDDACVNVVPRVNNAHNAPQLRGIENSMDMVRQRRNEGSWEAHIGKHFGTRINRIMRET